MVSNVNELMLKKANNYFNSKKYNDAIRVYYKLIQRKPEIIVKIKAFMGLGKTLKYIYELELASKMYKNAFILARKLKDNELVVQIEKIIENIYVMKKDQDLEAVQIQFFMRSIMSLLSKFGKTDWF